MIKFTPAAVGKRVTIINEWDFINIRAQDTATIVRELGIREGYERGTVVEIKHDRNETNHAFHVKHLDGYNV